MIRAAATIMAGLIALFALSSPVGATNGDNLIAIGPISRSMGGVGIAAPQDAISAVFANPAAMCFGQYCPASEMNFSGSLFMPKVDAKVTNSTRGTFQADSEDNIYAIPAIGISVPMGSGPKNWRFGLSAYGVTGLGVDYRDTALDDPGFYDFGGGNKGPLVTGEYTQLQIMKFAPAFAFQPTAQLSFGLAMHVDYGNLDLRNGTSTGYGVGAQIGAIYHPTDRLDIGLTYISAQKVDHDNVTDFDNDGTADTLTLESPQQMGVGIAYELVDNRLLMEADIKWINWSDAEGYSDFDWNDQWVFAVGAQYEPMENLFFRVGYNYAKNPVETHDNFDGTTSAQVQGKTIQSKYYYETFRIIGFPAVVEHHLTLGVGYEFNESFSANIGYMHAFEETITEKGTDPFGDAVTLASTLSESSLEFGFTWRF